MIKRISGEGERWSQYQRRCQILWYLYKQYKAGQGSDPAKFSTSELAKACGLKVTQWFRNRLHELAAEGCLIHSTSPHRANVDKDLWQFVPSTLRKSQYRSFFVDAIAREKDTAQ